MKQSLKTKLKQLRFPAIFRLPEPEFSKEQLDLLEELIQLIQPTLSQVEKAASDERMGMARFLVDLGTGVWRIRRKIEGLSRIPKEVKDALYSLESTWASMAEGGVELVDHIGTIPSKGEAKIVEIRDIPDLTRDQVVETIKPTITLRGEVIQIGEVVMGRPAVTAVVAGTQPVAREREASEEEEEIRAAVERQRTADEPEEETPAIDAVSADAVSDEPPTSPGEPVEPETPESKKPRRTKKKDTAAEVEDIG